MALSADGELVTGRGLPGRGAWLCRGSPPCVRAAVRRRAFDRALRASPAPGAVERLARSFELQEVGGQVGPRVCEDGGPEAPVAGPSPPVVTPRR